MKKLTTILCAGLAVFVLNPTKTVAQDYKSLRTNTWSVYTQGGISWATGLEFKNINPSNGTSIAPEMGVGLNYNIRPWIRLGLNYEFSKFKREQRLTDFQAISPVADATAPTRNYGGMAYRKMWTQYHNLDLTAEFNIMQLWKSRKCTWFNLYAGTGIGAMFAKGNVYSIGMGYKEWTDENTSTGNNSTAISWVKAGNDRHNFNSLYIPIVLSAEFDVLPQLTLGVKGQYKTLLSSNDLAPDGLAVAAVTVRYNFVGSKQGLRSNKQKYNEALSKYNSSLEQCKDLRNQYEAEKAKARETEAAYKKSLNSLNELNAENGALKQQLKECKESNEVRNLTVMFDRGISKVSKENKTRLTEFAEQLKTGENVTIDLVGEASADGETTANQKLSEKRLANVISVLNKNGIDRNRIKSATAIGDTNKVYDASSRRVVITINR